MLQGDVGDIISALSEQSRIDWMSLTAEEAALAEARRSHCSSIVRLTPDMQQLYAAQNMWWNYYRCGNRTSKG